MMVSFEFIGLVVMPDRRPGVAGRVDIDGRTMLRGAISGQTSISHVVLSTAKVRHISAQGVAGGWYPGGSRRASRAGSALPELAAFH
ncbi:hypothetical protein PQR62_18945 [Herbaspirillum lusitanum]|uniref:Uncharacterized protein n=1 Tax=Herbaspirillum lusitanum TaxID=213312 RepID=A0ABW9ABT1_9BURK